MTPEVTVRCVRCQAPLGISTQTTISELRCAGCQHPYAVRNGIFILGEAATPEDYPKELYELLASVGSRHFWFEGRNSMILAMLRKALGKIKGLSALELGCGTGIVMSALERAGMQVTGVDMHLEGLLHARKHVRGCLVQSATPQIHFSVGFDSVLLCDVIEHVSDDVSAIRQASLALREGGALLVTVPADSDLWTPVDAASGHKRRYSKEMLIQAMRSAGLSVSDARYFNILLWPVLRLQRGCMKALPEDFSTIQKALKVPPSWLNAILAAAMSADRLLSRVTFLRGGSIIAVGHRE